MQTGENIIDTVQVGAQIPLGLAEQLARKAKANDRSVAAELRLAIRAHLDLDERTA